jgi:hypothetical protein
MQTLIDKVNASPELANLPLLSDGTEQVGSMTPVLATPAAFAAGIAAAAGVAGAVAAGAAVGAAID